MQKLIKIQGADAKYREFVDFDITSVTTPEQITELDKKLAEIAQSFEIQAQLEVIDGNKEYEKAFYDELREEVAIEIKKDSDRIENAHKVFVALETGNLDEILQDPETYKIAFNEYYCKVGQKKELAEQEERNKKFTKLMEYIVKSDDPRLDKLCLMQTQVFDDWTPDYKCNYPSFSKSVITVREAMLMWFAGVPRPMRQLEGTKDMCKGWASEILGDEVDVEKKMLRNIERKKEKREDESERTADSLSKNKEAFKVEFHEETRGALRGMPREMPEWITRYIPELRGQGDFRWRGHGENTCH